MAREIGYRQAITQLNQALVTFRRLHDQDGIEECEEDIAQAEEHLVRYMSPAFARIPRVGLVRRLLV